MAASACSDCMADCSTPSRLSLISKGKLEIIGKHYGACLRHRALAYGRARKRSRRLRRFDRWRWSVVADVSPRQSHRSRAMMAEH